MKARGQAHPTNHQHNSWNMQQQEVFVGPCFQMRRQQQQTATHNKGQKATDNYRQHKPIALALTKKGKAPLAFPRLVLGEVYATAPHSKRQRPTKDTRPSGRPQKDKKQQHRNNTKATDIRHQHSSIALTFTRQRKLLGHFSDKIKIQRKRAPWVFQRQNQRQQHIGSC